jgi:hypothetical protein
MFFYILNVLGTVWIEFTFTRKTTIFVEFEKQIAEYWNDAGHSWLKSF